MSMSEQVVSMVDCGNSTTISCSNCGEGVVFRAKGASCLCFVWIPGKEGVPPNWCNSDHHPLDEQQLNDCIDSVFGDEQGACCPVTLNQYACTVSPNHGEYHVAGAFANIAMRWRA